MNLSRKPDEANLHLHPSYDNNDYPLAAPGVPQDPPVSYSEPYGRESESQLPARSFSQRAKGNMLTPEALEDYEYWDDQDHIPSQTKISGSLQQKGTDHEDGRVAVMNRSNHAERERPFRNDLPPTPDIPSQNGRASRDHPRSLQHPADIAPLKLDMRSTSSRANTVGGPKILDASRRRDWASGRSPLQMLEVELNHISKAEKRARVEEAEMLLESKAGRAGRPAGNETLLASDTANPARESPLQPGNIEFSRLDHTNSDIQPGGVQPRGKMGFQKPEQRFPPDRSGQWIDLEEQRPGGMPIADEAAPFPDQPKSQQHIFPDGGQPHPAHDNRAPEPLGMARRGSLRDPIKAEQPHLVHHPRLVNVTRRTHDGVALHPEQGGKQLPNGVRRVNSNKQAPVAVAQSIPSNITRAISLQQRQPPPFPLDNQWTSRPRPVGESNSLHGAASAEATAAVGVTSATAATTTSLNTPRKLQKHSPGNARHSSHIGRDITGRDRVMSMKTEVTPVSISAEAPQFSTVSPTQEPKVEFYHNATQKEVEVQRMNSRRGPETVGLGLRGPSVPDSNSMTNGPRQTSVSFKVPFDKARPVNEWKQAGTARLTLADLALGVPSEPDQAWWEMNGPSSRRRSKRSSDTRGLSAASAQQRKTKNVEFNPPLYLKCGPLLRYTGTRRDRGQSQPGQANNAVVGETWRGSVMIVTHDPQSSYAEVPTLRLFSQPKDLFPPPPEQVQVDDLAPEYVDPVAGLTKVSRRGETLYVKPVDCLEEGKDLSRIENDDGLFETSPSQLDSSMPASVTSTKRIYGISGESLGNYREVKAARLYADIEREVTFWRFNIEVELSDRQAHIAYRINQGAAIGFWVPAKGQTMNVMFHSCNGFSLSVNANQFGGPDPLWRDVLNAHQTRPFHVMIGGGDQLYNDRVMIDTNQFAAWTHIRNAHDKHHAPFTDEMREELETFYLNRYAMWFSQGLFGLANSQIPMVNIYDDHDIIDGFGSYPDDFQRSPVFMGVGNIAFKYYMLFQHQSVPEETQADEPSWVLGAKPGPYIRQLSRSIFVSLGKSMAFLGLDCRTERERYSVLTDDTYDIVLDRCRREIQEGETKHLLVLLGVPLAYPRLIWLENLLASRAMKPMKALGRAGFFKGGLLNRFDGGVEVLDDLDDHWTASGHKEERNNLLHDLQDLAAEKSVRITLLGGDVHLAAIGQFYSTPKLKIPKDRDHRYMPNVISSAIVNAPPPELLADTLNKRNKVHHLDNYTVEDMIPMFTHDVDGKRRNNQRLLPRRNWCSIREYQPGSTPPPSPLESATPSDQISEEQTPQTGRRFSFSTEFTNPRKLLRRLSQRGDPPSSYRDDMNMSGPIPARRASHDGYFPNPQQPRTAPPTRTSFTMTNSHQTPPETAPPNRTSFHSTAPYDLRASIDALASAPPPRPGIFRRPTNLSEKAAKEGGAPLAIDSQGNLIGDMHDHINLEGGLDITLNCEVSQGDAAGITTPYRLLVPALRYDGTSDSQALNFPGGITGAGMQRKPTLLNKLGFGRTGDRSLADRQGEGNWGQASESESGSIEARQYDEEDDEVYEKGKRSSGGGAGGLKRLFSGRRARKQERQSPEYEQQQQQAVTSGPARTQTQDESLVRESSTSSPREQYQFPQPRPQASAPSTKHTYNTPSDEPYPSQARGKAARVMGVDQGPLPSYSQPPLLSPPLSHPQQEGATANTRVTVSVNQSQPLPPPTTITRPSPQQASKEGGARNEGGSRSYTNYDLSNPPPNGSPRGGSSVAPAAVAGTANVTVRPPIVHGYNGVEAYRESRPRRLSKWF